MIPITFANPFALWALLGIPAILLIHFLQRERRQVLVSTLFLLDTVRQQSESGIRFERLRNSLPLWLQLLAVVMITWVLAEPRWPSEQSFQRVVVVLDSSASMMPFKEVARDELNRRLGRMARSAVRSEWIALESDSRRGTLYSGDDIGELRDSLGNWQPRSGTHDPEPALRQAQALLRGEGTALFVTNRLHDTLPAGTHLLAVGEPIANCGFTGLRFTERDDRQVWRVVLKNFSDERQRREWYSEFDGRTSEARTVELGPGQAVTLSGMFPEGASAGALHLSGDAFPLDDWLPLARPQPKELTIAAEQHPMLSDFMETFLRSVPHWTAGSSGSADRDLHIATRLPSQENPRRPGIYFLLERDEPREIPGGAIIAGNHPLMRDLNWQGLLMQSEAAPPAPAEDDVVLLWQGERPLLVLRRSRGGQWLFCNFDLRYSNATRLPAFVILLHRFVESMREEKPAFERRNLETGQRFTTGVEPLGGTVEVRHRQQDGTWTREEREPHRARNLTAPRDPGFLEVRQGDNLLISAAAYFADSRQADFRTASSEERGEEMEIVLRERLTRRDFFTPFWLLLLGGIMLFTWRVLGTR